MSLLQPGRCRHCGCGGDSCRLPDGERCCWTDGSRDVCTYEPCQRAEAALLARAAAKEKKAPPRAAKAGKPKPDIAAWRAMSRRGLPDDFIWAELQRRARRRKGRAA